MADGREAARRDGIVHPGWMPFYEATHIPAAVRAGQTLYLTGHAGDAADGTFPSDVESQVRNAFANLDATLQAAGAEWSDVVQVTSYHIGVREQVPIMLEVAAEFFEEPYPAWMAVGVAELLDEEGVIDIACTVVIRRQ